MIMPTISPIVCGWTVPSPPNLLSACYNPHESASGFRAFFNAHDLASGSTTPSSFPRSTRKTLVALLNLPRFVDMDGLTLKGSPSLCPAHGLVIGRVSSPLRNPTNSQRYSHNAYGPVEERLTPLGAHKPFRNVSTVSAQRSVYSRMRSALQQATQSSQTLLQCFHRLLSAFRSTPG